MPRPLGETPYSNRCPPWSQLRTPQGRAATTPPCSLAPHVLSWTQWARAVGKHVFKNCWLPWLFHLCQLRKEVVQEELVMALIFESLLWDQTVFQFRWKDKVQCCVFYEDWQNLRVVWGWLWAPPVSTCQLYTGDSSFDFSFDENKSSLDTL